MNTLIKKKFIRKLFVSIILSFLISYTIALRFTDFLMFTRGLKIVQFISLFIPIGLLIFFIVEPFISFLQKGISLKNYAIIILTAFILSAVIFSIFYQFPAFPQDLNLEILRYDSPGTDYHRGELLINSITRVDLPSETKAPVNVEQLTFEAPWFSENDQLQTRYGDPSKGTIKYSRFMQARLDIEFQTAPAFGTVVLKWNGDTLIYDLYSPEQSTKLVQLSPSLRWERADLTRKAFLGVNLISEFLLISTLFFLTGLIIIRLFIIKDISIRGVWVLLAVLFVSAVFIFASNRLQKKVLFDDPNLENVIRLKINKPEGAIYSHQLLTIATLDASHQEIMDLTGIENLKNLKSLNLSGNAISDLAPLAALKKLTDLDLSENQIVDLQEAHFDSLKGLRLERLSLRSNISLSRTLLRPGLSNIRILKDFTALQELDLGQNQVENISPLVNLNNLVILNLDSNKITSIKPLENLNNLEHLNLSFNEISNISNLQNLDQLEYLNLSTNTGITDLSPLGNLLKLEDLNLNNIYVGDSLGFIRNLNRLNELDVSNCGISDLSDIGFLMERGQLQDNPDNGIFAELNIRDNPLEVKEWDSFAPVRDHWSNITFRDPVALPIFVTLSSPTFSHDGGFYINEFQLEIQAEDPNLVILYTLDGSEPNINNIGNNGSYYQQTIIYENPITVENRAGDPNVFSMFNTADLVDEWQVSWSPPKGEVYKANVIRALVYDESTGAQSSIVTHTYFVDPEIYSRYSTLPVISITSDYQYLFDPDTGIYTSAKLSGIFYPPFTYNESIVPASIEFFNQDGSLGFDGNYEIQLQGNTSKASPQKGLTVSANSWYGDEMINYPLFSTSESEANQITSFKQFILRAWGSAGSWPVMFADAYHQTLMAKADQDIQDYRPVIVFINGEYWGLHEMREADKNSWYHQEHTGIDRENPGYDLIDGGYNEVDEGSAEDWDALMAFIASHDISLDENYQHIKEEIDIDNFIHYVIHCIYTGKRDWPDHNESKWRVHDDSGKWRWIQYDMDHGLSQFGRPEYDMVYHTAFDEEHLHPLFAALLVNDEFKQKFINTFADDLNTYFSPNVELDHYREMAAELEPYIPEYQDRWGLIQDWDEGYEYGLKLIKRRHDMRWDQLIKNFKLAETVEITLMADPNMGHFQINSVAITQDTPGVVDPAKWSGSYFMDQPIQITAIPEPGYQFERWEGVDSGSDNAIITITPTRKMIIRAVFSPNQ